MLEVTEVAARCAESCDPRWRGSSNLHSSTSRLVVTYVVGLVPGMLLMAFVPWGEHVGYLPLCLGLLVGAGLGCIAWRFAPRLENDTGQQRGLLLAILLPYQLWTGHVLMAFLNRALDESPAQVHELTVLSLEKRSKGSDRVELEHWRPGAGSFSVAGHYPAGTRLAVSSHEGWLGFEWVEPVRPLEPVQSVLIP